MAEPGFRQAALPGGAEPRRRLPVSPGAVKAAASVARRRLRVPDAFPLAPPTWPGTVERPPAEKTLGVHYDSDWARTPAARLGRALVQDLVSAPAVRALAHPEVRGLDRIAHLDEPVIFAANHASHLDAPLLVSVIPERWRRELFVAGAADYFFDTRVKATAFAFLLNTVPIERQRVSRDSVNRVSELLADGWSMLIFPEGGRSPDGWGQPHQAGPAWMAARAGRPIVPVHVEGTGRILAKGSRKLRPGRSTVNFGRPLQPGQDRRALASELEAAIAALADEVGSDWYTARRRAAAGTTPPLTGPDAAGWRRAWALGERDGSARRRGRSERWPR
ncbi:MAG TPA: lysophospholipid acyltransferase family protein [Acidimicrobiales bacterium]|nr:lysophospholipid acyltransferase family protein [Acidimicrobiales bacterium]